MLNTDAQAPILENRYQILGLLGRGGMGAVYVARDLRFQQRTVALKENCINGEASREQFRQEAEVLARLRHAYLPRVTDNFSTPDGRQFLVMDYIEGVSLEEYIAQNGPISEEQARVWMDQILDALDYLHRQSPPIIHRDVKPANIRITPAGDAVLVDFGLTKLLTPGAMTASVVQKAGSPGYAPIEQYAGGTDQRSDIYGVGAAFYFALTGQPPVASPLRAAGQALARPRQLNPTLSMRVDAALMRALAVNADARFLSAADMWASLKGQSGPLEAGGRLLSSFKPARQKVLLGLTVMLGLMLLATGGGIWRIYNKDKDKPTRVTPSSFPTMAVTEIPLPQEQATARPASNATPSSTPTPRLETSTPKPSSTPTFTPVPPTLTPVPLTQPPPPTAAPPTQRPPPTPVPPTSIPEAPASRP